MNRTWWLGFFFLFGTFFSQPYITLAEAPPSEHRELSRQPLTGLAETMSPELPADTIMRRHHEHGTITFLKSANLAAVLEQDADFRTLQTAKRHGDMVLAFLTRYRQLFKLREPEREFTVTSIDADHLGFTHVRLQQQFAGIAVWGAELIAHINRTQHVYLIQGRYIPTPEQVQTSPVLTVEDALQVAAQALGRPPSECPQCEAMLMIFAAAYQVPRLSYRVEASTSLTERWGLMIDAIHGAVLEKRAIISNPGPFLKRR
jgi:Zn-dependent metalloprotease